MDAKLKEKIEGMMEEGSLGYAYLYPSDMIARQEFVFSMTPKNIANFLGSHFLDARKMILTDPENNIKIVLRSDNYGRKKQ